MLRYALQSTTCAVVGKPTSLVPHTQDPSRQLLHSCIINLVIGTLYCCKGNYAFGLSRVLRSLDPLPTKLNVDTWHYAKRCIVALLDHMTKQMVALKVCGCNNRQDACTCGTHRTRRCWSCRHSWWRWRAVARSWWCTWTQKRPATTAPQPWRRACSARCCCQCCRRSKTWRLVVHIKHCVSKPLQIHN